MAFPSAWPAKTDRHARGGRTCCWLSGACPTPTAWGSICGHQDRCARLHRRRRIAANDEPRVWALGDCNGKGAFTHTAYNDYEIVADNLLSGAGRKYSDRVPVYALYTDPPLGRVGMNEADIMNAGIRALVGKLPMTRVLRAVEKGETQGFPQDPRRSRLESHPWRVVAGDWRGRSSAFPHRRGVRKDPVHSIPATCPDPSER
jgi:hypothetical protein